MLDVCRSGARMASAGSDKVVRLWEPGSAVQTSCLRGMMDSITDLAFTSDQDHIIAAGSDKSLRLWDIGSARERHTLTGHSDKVQSRSRLLRIHAGHPLQKLPSL